MILGTLGTLSRRGALDPAERREFVDMAVRQGIRLKELIEQLLLAARFEQAGQEPAERSLVDAAKHAPDWSPVRLEVTRYGPQAVLAVEDTGPGVPGADRERIFERFTQLDSGATRRAGGVGLGLYIARRLARDQDGELLLADPTPPSRGARFELRLPLADRSRS